jgi:hypothetical protein
MAPAYNFVRQIVLAKFRVGQALLPPLDSKSRRSFCPAFECLSYS